MRYEINGTITTVYDSHGNSFIIDTDQLEKILVCNWYVNEKGYVRTCSRKYGRIYLHRFLLNTNSMVDHKNRIKTDNRLCNLRLCTYQENNRNRVYKHTQSGAQGVSVRVRNGKTSYRARACVDGKRISLGYYDTLAEAIKARAEAVENLYTEYAPCNTPEN